MHENYELSKKKLCILIVMIQTRIIHQLASYMYSFQHISSLVETFHTKAAIWLAEEFIFTFKTVKLAIEPLNL